jgi:hypothetical protein
MLKHSYYSPGRKKVCGWRVIAVYILRCLFYFELIFLKDNEYGSLLILVIFNYS